MFFLFLSLLDRFGFTPRRKIDSTPPPPPPRESGENPENIGHAVTEMAPEHLISASGERSQTPRAGDPDTLYPADFADKGAKTQQRRRGGRKETPVIEEHQEPALLETLQSKFDEFEDAYQHWKATGKGDPRLTDPEAHAYVMILAQRVLGLRDDLQSKGLANISHILEGLEGRDPNSKNKKPGSSSIGVLENTPYRIGDKEEQYTRLKKELEEANRPNDNADVASMLKAGIPPERVARIATLLTRDREERLKREAALSAQMPIERWMLRLGKEIVAETKRYLASHPAEIQKAA